MNTYVAQTDRNQAKDEASLVEELMTAQDTTAVVKDSKALLLVSMHVVSACMCYHTKFLLIMLRIFDLQEQLQANIRQSTPMEVMKPMTLSSL